LFERPQQVGVLFLVGVGEHQLSGRGSTGKAHYVEP